MQDVKYLLDSKHCDLLLTSDRSYHDKRATIHLKNIHNFAARFYDRQEATRLR